MKKIILALAIIVFSIGLVNAQEKNNLQETGNAVILIDSTKYDFGKIKQSQEPLKHVFIVKNTGDKPLILQRIQTGCGCVKSDHTHEPILPNKEGEIILYYEINHVGKFNRRIVIFSNAKNSVYNLEVRGEVVE